MEDHEYPAWLWNLIGDGRAANKQSLGAQDESRGVKWGEDQAKRLVRKTCVSRSFSLSFATGCELGRLERRTPGVSGKVGREARRGIGGGSRPSARR